MFLKPRYLVTGQWDQIYPLEGTKRLIGTLKNDVDFRGVNLSGLDLSAHDLSGALFDQTTVFSFEGQGVNLSGTGANLSNVDLSNLDFRGVNLSGIDLSDRNISGINLSGAQLFETKLDHADLSDANLTDANLSSALFSIFTIWPTGYDPITAGATRSDQKFLDYLSAVSTTAQTDANQTAQSAVLANPNEFDLFREEEKYLVSADPNHTSYGIGYAEANATLVLQASENPNSLGFFTEDNRSTTVARSSVTALAKIQADLGMQGLSLVSYLEQSRDTNATQTTEWYYQPEHGWIWTNRTVYPYLYKIPNSVEESNETESGSWLFHNTSGPDGYYFYDFGIPGWVNPF